MFRKIVVIAILHEKEREALKNDFTYKRKDDYLPESYGYN